MVILVFCWLFHKHCCKVHQLYEHDPLSLLLSLMKAQVWISVVVGAVSLHQNLKKKKKNILSLKIAGRPSPHIRRTRVIRNSPQTLHYKSPHYMFKFESCLWCRENSNMITVEASTKVLYNFASDHFKWSIKCVTIQSNVVRIHTIRRYSHVDLPNPNHQCNFVYLLLSNSSCIPNPTYLFRTYLACPSYW